ncbi:MAG: formyl transferase [Pelagibacterales bacterium]|nr:formyl transferase [Pelagibacterales bacterium]
MKILLFLNQDIHAKKAFEILQSHLQKHEVQLVLSSQVGKTQNLSSKLIQLKSIEQEGVQSFFDALKLPILQYQNINSEEALKDFKEFAPNLAISIRFGQIFKQEFINLPKFGVLNLHSGILPHYRGVMASFWAILNGEKNLGTTLHYIQNEGIDNGDIIDFSHSEIDWNENFISNVNNLYKGGCKLIIEALDQIEKDEKIAITKQQSLGEGNYFSYPKEEDLEKFAKLMRLF